MSDFRSHVREVSSCCLCGDTPSSGEFGRWLEIGKTLQVIAEPLLAVDIRLIYFELLSIVGVLRKRDSVNWLECDEKLPCP